MLIGRDEPSGNLGRFSSKFSCGEGGFQISIPYSSRLYFVFTSWNPRPDFEAQPGRFASRQRYSVTRSSSHLASACQSPGFEMLTRSP